MVDFVRKSAWIDHPIGGSIFEAKTNSCFSADC